MNLDEGAFLHPHDPRRMFDANDYERRAEAVAERHARTFSPEFCEWFADDRGAEELARLAFAPLGTEEHQAITRNTLRAIRDDWRRYVAGTIDSALQREIRREP